MYKHAEKGLFVPKTSRNALMKKAKCIGLVTTKSETLSLYVTAYHNYYSRSFPQWLLIFSLSAMLSKAERRERVFSVAKHTIFNERASLRIDIFQALECLKSLFCADIFTQKDLIKAFQNQPREA